MQGEGGEGGAGVARREPHGVLPPPEDLVVRPRAVGGSAYRHCDHPEPAHAGGLRGGTRQLLHGVRALRHVRRYGGTVLLHASYL